MANETRVELKRVISALLGEKANDVYTTVCCLPNDTSDDNVCSQKRVLLRLSAFVLARDGFGSISVPFANIETDAESQVNT